MLLSGGICSLPGLLNNPALCSNRALAKDQQTKSGFVLLDFFPAKITLLGFFLPHSDISEFPNCDFGELHWEQGVGFGVQPLSHPAWEQGEFISALCNQRLVEKGNSQWAFHIVPGMCQHWKAHFDLEFFLCSYIFWLIHCSVSKLHFKLGKCISYLLYLQASQL